MLRYAITDRHLFRGDEAARRDALLAQAAHLAVAGVDLLQLREKDLPERELEALAHGLAAALDRLGPQAPRLLLNGPASVAVASGAHGLHLRSTAGPHEIEAVRQAFEVARRSPPILSISCHSLEDVRAAASNGLDYLLFGPVFEKRVGGELVAQGLGIACLREAARIASPSRLLALGGVNQGNAPLCLEAGASGIAGIRLFL